MWETTKGGKAGYLPQGPGRVTRPLEIRMGAEQGYPEEYPSPGLDLTLAWNNLAFRMYVWRRDAGLPSAPITILPLNYWKIPWFFMVKEKAKVKVNA